jgi:hypothetical protein
MGPALRHKRTAKCFGLFTNLWVILVLEMWSLELAFSFVKMDWRIYAFLIYFQHNAFRETG